MVPVPLKRSRDKDLSKHLVYDPLRIPFYFEVTCHRPLRRQSPKTNKSRPLSAQSHQLRQYRSQSKDNYPQTPCSVSNPQGEPLALLFQSRHV
ncbi:hypothetical protein TNCV_394831 [Trichonephila clavipes]|nr:hypothetical protein TNCV_394831 [Trichonephila clavipes]